MTHAELLHFFTTQKFGDKGLRLAAERAAEALREIDAAWFMIEHGWDIESREELERQSRTNGFKYGLAQAIHHLGKRCVIENAWMESNSLASGEEKA